MDNRYLRETRRRFRAELAQARDREAARRAAVRLIAVAGVLPPAKKDFLVLALAGAARAAPFGVARVRAALAELLAGSEAGRLLLGLSGRDFRAALRAADTILSEAPVAGPNAARRVLGL